MSEGKLFGGIIALALLVIGGAAFFILRPAREDTTSPMATVSDRRPSPAAAKPASGTQAPPTSRPTLAATKPTDDQVQAEIARLRAENQRLRESIQKVVIDADSPAPLPVVSVVPNGGGNGSIEGAAWVKRQSGESQIVRGMTLVLIPSRCPPQIIVECLKESAAERDRELKEDKKRADEYRSSPYSADFAKIYDDSARRHSEALNQINRNIQSTTAPMETVMAAEMIRAHASFAAPLSAFAKLAVAEARTNVDGKYAFKEVPAGKYVIFGQESGGRFLVQWMLPVHVKPGATAQVDLDNGNAFDIKNVGS